MKVSTNQTCVLIFHHLQYSSLLSHLQEIVSNKIMPLNVGVRLCVCVVLDTVEMAGAPHSHFIGGDLKLCTTLSCHVIGWREPHDLPPNSSSTKSRTS